MAFSRPFVCTPKGVNLREIQGVNLSEIDGVSLNENEGVSLRENAQAPSGAHSREDAIRS